MDIYTKLFLTNAFFIVFFAYIDVIFNITTSNSVVQRFILDPWLVLTIASIPSWIVYVIWR